METPTQKMKIMIACGGTGGHIFPGVAVAEVFKRLHPEIEVIFAGTQRGLEKEIIPALGWKLLCIDSTSIKDRSGLGRLGAYALLPFSLAGAYRLLKKENPQLLLGVGGYAAGPLTLAASLMKIPTAIIEPNAIAGFTNRLLGRFVDRIYIGFCEAGEFFPRKKVANTGNPVRHEIVELREKINIKRDELTVFCFGGSQGAVAVNQALIEALSFLAKGKKKIKFIHQIGQKEDRQKIEQAYVQHGFEAKVFEFTDQIWDIYAQTDLIIGRSGATTIAEVAVMGLPAILIPYPWAADNHQVANAQCLDRCGGAVMILQKDLNGETLAAEIMKLNPDKLLTMRSALLNCGKPNAAEKIVEDCLGLINRKNMSGPAASF